MRKSFGLVVLLAFIAACQGMIGDGPGSQQPNVEAAEASTRDLNVPAYKQASVQVRLLPFSVRLTKLAAVVDLATTDVVFSDVVRRRYQLGDYDFANGIVADNAWSASRMTSWVESIGPVCSSSQMHTRFPELPGKDLGKLYLAAHGRDVTADEVGAIDAAMEGISMTADDRYSAVCRAVLASLEFVAQ